MIMDNIVHKRAKTDNYDIKEIKVRRESRTIL